MPSTRSPAVHREIRLRLTLVYTSNSPADNSRSEYPVLTESRDTGISVIGEVPWGTHFCTFYETTQDLLDILVPFFKVGLETKEFCLWIISEDRKSVV